MIRDMRTYIISLLLFLATVAVATQAQTATHPLTGSSIVNQAVNAIALSQLGFKVSGIPDSWVYNKSLTEDSKTIEIGTSEKTLLSFRLEDVSIKTQLETYVRQYLRDYNQYGFEVTGLQSLSRNEIPTIIVDLKQKNKPTRSRQTFFYKQNKMIVATCADETEKFDSTIQICNQILSSFEWRDVK